VPGKYIPYDGTEDLTHLINVLHDGVNFLDVILPDFLITRECQGIVDSTPQEGSATSEAPEPDGKPKM